jgi:hypothetical protein
VEIVKRGFERASEQQNGGNVEKAEKKLEDEEWMTRAMKGNVAEEKAESEAEFIEQTSI